MEERNDNRRLLNRWEILFLLIAIFIILYLILQNFGINLVEVTEESEIIQRPHD